LISQSCDVIESRVIFWGIVMAFGNATINLGLSHGVLALSRPAGLTGIAAHRASMAALH
jgi:hypothetical protein